MCYFRRETYISEVYDLSNEPYGAVYKVEAKYEAASSVAHWLGKQRRGPVQFVRDTK